MKVDHVHVDGVKRTKNDILTKHVKDVFTANNFEDVSFSYALIKDWQSNLWIAKAESVTAIAPMYL